MQLLERAVQGEERPVEHKERQRSHSDEWLTLSSTPMRELDLEPLDYQLDLSKEVTLLLIGIVHPKRKILTSFPSCLDQKMLSNHALVLYVEKVNVE